MPDELDPQKADKAASQPAEKATTSAKDQESSQGAEAVPGGAEEGKEPGGADGTAVYARKEHRRAETLKAELDRERLLRAEQEGRLKALEEQAKKQQDTQAQPKIYTVAELEAGVANGQITREDAEQYKFEVIVPRQVQAATEARDRARREQEAKERPLAEAKRSLEEYTRLYPWLTDSTNARTQEIVQRYNQLVTTRGLPGNEITSELAISQILGSLDKAAQRKEVDNLTSRNTGTFAEAGAGGTANSAATSNALSKVPKEMVDGWKKMGITDPKKLEQYAQHHLLKAQRRRATIGV